MKRQAFTLVELLVVISVVALLATVVMPVLSGARSLTRSTLCQHNLHQLAQAFHAASAQTRGVPVHRPDAWPGVPMDVVGEPRIYLCPEQQVRGESGRAADMRKYYIHSNWDGRTTQGAGVDIYFDPGEHLCRIVRETDEYIDYGFEDGINYDLYRGSIDITIRVSKNEPRTATYVSDRYQGATSPAWGILSLRVSGKTVPGWEDFRRVATGSSFLIGGSLTDYGMNAAVGVHDVAGDTIVLLDYGWVVANAGEDVGACLPEAAKRHRGKVNVLFADESVRGVWSAELDPGVGSAAELWTP